MGLGLLNRRLLCGTSGCPGVVHFRRLLVSGRILGWAGLAAGAVERAAAVVPAFASSSTTRLSNFSIRSSNSFVDSPSLGVDGACPHAVPAARIRTITRSIRRYMRSPLAV